MHKRENNEIVAKIHFFVLAAQYFILHLVTKFFLSWALASLGWIMNLFGLHCNHIAFCTLSLTVSSTFSVQSIIIFPSIFTRLPFILLISFVFQLSTSQFIIAATQTVLSLFIAIPFVDWVSNSENFVVKLQNYPSYIFCKTLSVG